MLKKILKNTRGTALLIALLVMGVFIAVSLALSSLILREVRITKAFIDAGQAYYSAESGIEIALYALNTRLPGWQPEDIDQDGFKSFAIDEGRNTVGEFSLENRCKAYPCFDEDEYDLQPVRDAGKSRYFYDVLDLNESLTIPLFVAEGDTVKNVEDFVVEFFSPINPQEHLKFDDKENLYGWDVLRWKLIGIRPLGSLGAGETETISDFSAVSMLAHPDEEERIASNATAPSWFGTKSCSGEGELGFSDRYFDEIVCAPYVFGSSQRKYVIDTSEFGQVAKIAGGACGQHEAKEFYVYEYDWGEKRVGKIETCYPIKRFMEDHTLNYLVLTNLVNPSVLSQAAYSDKEKLSRLFFRLELDSANAGGEDEANAGLIAETVRPVANITANGYSGNSKQSINVKVARGSFMPVFNFSLYSTYMDSEGVDSEDGIHDFDYWYKEQEDLSL